MNKIELQLLFFFLVTMIGFIILIFFLLKLRKSQLKKSLLLTASDVWKTVEGPALALGLERKNLLYGIIQDHSFTEAVLLLRNSNDEVVGEAFFPTGKRNRRMIVGDQNYVIEFPLTLNRTARLRKEDGQEVLVSYAKTSWSGKHKFEVPDHGTFISSQKFLNLKASRNYIHDGQVVGMIQNISSTKNLDRLAILPETLPLEIRLFILSL